MERLPQLQQLLILDDGEDSVLRAYANVERVNTIFTAEPKYHDVEGIRSLVIDSSVIPTKSFPSNRAEVFLSESCVAKCKDLSFNGRPSSTSKVS
jgi:hypothetical protein